jgi:Recombination endonuclease VII
VDDATPRLFVPSEKLTNRLKLCPSCDEAKPAAEFYANRSKPDGLDTNCRSCRQQWYRDAPPRDVVVATATCSKCGETKPAAEFGPFKTKLNGLTPCCNPCRRKPSGGYRRYNLRRYGLTLTAYDEMLARQGGRCAICRTENPGGKQPEYFNVDHDRSCCPGFRSCGKCVRGLLCAQCNFGLGNFRDDVTALRAAADYLEAHEEIDADDG